MRVLQENELAPAHSANAQTALLARALSSPLGRAVVPSLPDLLLIAILLWLFVIGPGPGALLFDGDIGWHIRTGDYILEHGAVPQSDIFTFTKYGQPWFAWEWMSDVLFSALHTALGLKGVVFLAGVVLAVWPVVVLRHSMWAGGNVWAVLVTTLLAAGASTSHFLARPHVFTMLFTAVAAWLIAADRRVAGRKILWILPLTVLWTNLHGGFVVVILLLVLAAAGALLDCFVNGGPRRAPMRYGLLGFGCLCCSLLNPYGMRLHGHIWTYLNSDWIRQAVREFQAPDFRSESLAQFEVLLLLGLIAAAWLLARRRFVEALWILAFAHLALNSVRHVPLFSIVAAPLVAEAASDRWRTWMLTRSRQSIARVFDQLGADLAPSFRRFSCWPCVVGVVLFLPGAVQWPRNFPSSHFPVDLVQRNAETIRDSRIMTVDQWADYLLYAYYPRQRVFGDGRSDFLGRELGEEYLRTMNGQSGWRESLDRYRVQTILAPSDSPLVALLRAESGWQALDTDARAVLFRRAGRL